MSIDTYSQLKIAVETWGGERLSDPTITGNAADFIALGEARLTRELPLRVMWTNAPLTGTLDSRELVIPATFAEPGFLKLTTGDCFDEIRKQPASTMQYYARSGAPSEWCINGANIDLNRPCPSALTFLFRYRAKFALSDAAPTNWLLTNHPDIYLAGTLMWSGLLVAADDIASWGALLRDGIDRLLELDAKADGDVELEVDFALRGPRFYDGRTDMTA